MVKNRTIIYRLIDSFEVRRETQISKKFIYMIEDSSKPEMKG